MFTNQGTIFGGNVGDIDRIPQNLVNGKVTSYTDYGPGGFHFLCHTSSTAGAFLNCLVFSHSSELASYPLNQVRYSTTYLPLLPFFLWSPIIISTSYSSNLFKLAQFRDLVGQLLNLADEG